VSLEAAKVLLGAAIDADGTRRGGTVSITAGDRVLAVETEQGILLTPYTEELDADLAATRRAAKRYRSALRELAK